MCIHYLGHFSTLPDKNILKVIQSYSGGMWCLPIAEDVKFISCLSDICHFSSTEQRFPLVTD
jgi:hypothetical protein